MKNLISFCIFLVFFSSQIGAQETSVDYIETEAVIKEISFKIKSRRSITTAIVGYKTLEGDSLSSTVKLAHIPFIAPLNKEGDIITVLYNKKTPLLLHVTTESK